MALPSSKVPTLAAVPNERRLPDWISSFVEATEPLAAPKIWREWAAISAIAGALERKTWVTTRGRKLYPNLYVIICGPPGVGKSVTTTEVEHLWRGVGDLHVAPNSLTKASLVDAVQKAERKIVRPHDRDEPVVTFHSLQIMSSELSDLVPAYDPAFMSTLQTMYDCQLPQFVEERRTGSLRVEIPNPQLNLLAATTPSYLASLMPEGAWDQGFISRSIIVYAGEQVRRSLWDDNVAIQTDKLLHDLKRIAGLYGKFDWTPEAAAAIDEWQLAGGPPAVTYFKLIHYNTRRLAHLIKLCQIMSASRSDELLIRLEDYQRALDVLVAAEAFMPDVFKSMGGKSDNDAMEHCYRYLTAVYAKGKKNERGELPGVHRHRLVDFLRQKVPSYAVMKIIEVMEQAEMILRTGIDKNGAPLYKPAGRITF